MLITYFKLGSQQQNFEVPEGSTVGDMFKRENIVIANNHVITVNSEQANKNQVLEDGDKVVVTKNEIKGGLTS